MVFSNLEVFKNDPFGNSSGEYHIALPKIIEFKNYERMPLCLSLKKILDRMLKFIL